MKILCPYRYIFGKPEEGIHSLRVYNIAINDVIMSLIGAYLLCVSFPKVPKYYFFVGIFVLGIVLHRLFCVRTTIDKLLFPNVVD